MNHDGAISTEPYKGVRDFYPEDWATLEYVFSTIRTLLKQEGYQEYAASPLERTELYESKSSEEIVNDQTYTFTDRGDRSVTLRPEMTPTLARMVAARRRELVFPVRWFSIPNVFRYERPQRGRLREHYQLNVDLLGIGDARADGEIIVLAHSIMRAFGAHDGDFVIRISSRTLLAAAGTAIGLTSEEFSAYFSLLDRKNKMTPEAFEEARNIFRKDGMDPLECIEAKTNTEVEAERTALMALLTAFKDRGMTNIVFDPTIVRGFLYYTGIIFEVFDTSEENARSLFGGGRYDNLVSLFGGDAIPAVGFGMGDVTLVDFLTTHSLLPDGLTGAPQIFVGTPTEDDIPAAHDFANTLRDQGLYVLVNVMNKGLGDQVKEAVRRTIPYFIAYGKNEADGASVPIKTLALSKEDIVSKTDIASFIHQPV